MAPRLAVDDVPEAVEWWRARLGFTLTFRQRGPDGPDAPPNYAVVERDDVEVHLARRAEITDRRRSEITITVADLPAFADELVRHGLAPARLPTGALAVHDPTGNRIVFRSP